MKNSSEQKHAICFAYIQGKSKREVAERFEVSRQWVDQVLAAAKIKIRPRATGPRPKTVARLERKAADVLARRDAFAMATLGCDFATQEAHRASGMLAAYRRQKGNAQNRGIGWLFTLPTWVEVWTTSGLWAERGAAIGCYCMSRHGDQGPYSPENVSIRLSQENSRDGFVPHTIKTAPNVNHVYPGLRRGWIARHARHEIGRFETEAEAVAAKQNYLQQGA